MTGPVQGLHGVRCVADGDQPVHHDGGRKLMALDCKINFDDNAMFRHKDLKELRDLAEEDPLEVEASKFNLNYIKLDGSLPAWSTVPGWRWRRWTSSATRADAGELPGCRRRSKPGADRAGVRDSAERSQREGDLHQHLWRHSAGRCAGDGGGCCDKKLNVKLPIILRLEGTNVEEGRKILTESGIKFQVGATMKEAADLAVAAAKGGK